MNTNSPQFPISHVNVVSPATDESTTSFPLAKMSVTTSDVTPKGVAPQHDEGGSYYSEAKGVSARAETPARSRQIAYNEASADRVDPGTRAYKVKDIGSMSLQGDKKTIKIRSGK